MAGDRLDYLFKNLRDRDYAREGLFVCEGRLVLEKALAAGYGIEALLCVPSDEGEWRRQLAAWAQTSAAISVMSRPDMEALVGFSFHRGVLALARRPEPAPWPAGPWRSEPRGLILWNVTDPDNLGTLIRSAAALSAGWVGFGPGCADPLGRKALRSGMGCALSLPLVYGIDVAALAALPGAVLAAALVPDALEPREARAFADRRGQTCLVLGNEGYGLPPEVLEASTARVIVPMAGSVDSLNVGAAGAILMWELFARG